METIGDGIGLMVVTKKEMPPRRSLAFQDSFRGFLDGSEFMKVASHPDTAESLDFVIPTSDDDDAREIEAAIINARKMARQCSLQTIGSYQPYDVVDPSTWNKKPKKKKSRDSTKSQRRSSMDSASTQESEIEQETAQTKERRPSCPGLSSLCDEHSDESDMKKKVRKSKRREGHRLRSHRSHSPRDLSGDKETRSGQKHELRCHRSHAPSRDCSGEREIRSGRKHAVNAGGELQDQFEQGFKEITTAMDCSGLQQTSFPSAARPSSWHDEPEDSNSCLKDCFTTTNEGSQPLTDYYIGTEDTESIPAIRQLQEKEKMLEQKLLETTRKLLRLNNSKLDLSLAHDASETFELFNGRERAVVPSKKEMRRASLPVSQDFDEFMVVEEQDRMGPRMWRHLRRAST